MLTNKYLSELYIDSGKDKEVIFKKVSEKVKDVNVRQLVDNWLKQFERRWERTRSKLRLQKYHAEWMAADILSYAATLDTSFDSPDDISRAKPGPDPKPFEDLAPSTKNEQSRVLARKENSLEKLLWAAEKEALRVKDFATAKVLNKLRTIGETWAASVEEESKKDVPLPSLETALEVKTRLGLSKSKYQGVGRYMAQYGAPTLFPPWKKIMELRDEILPAINGPYWDDGILTVSVGVRQMIENTARRIFDIDHVKHGLETLIVANDEPIACELHCTAGHDSATGYPHYNQENILQKDDSLLTESFLPLSIVTSTGVTLLLNPSPQSDMFCRPISMRWAKEEEHLSKKLFKDFYQTIDDVKANPIIIQVDDIQVSITVQAIYALIDGKVANFLTGNKNTKACPLCAPGADPRIGPHFFHSRLNVVELLIRLAAQKLVYASEEWRQIQADLPGSSKQNLKPKVPAQAHPLVTTEIRSISDDLEQEFKMNINRAKAGGSGSSNNGNMARVLLSRPGKFADILRIDPGMVENVRLLSSLALSSNKLDADKMEKLYNDFEQQMREEFPFVTRLPPCVHKYSHVPALSNELPYPLRCYDEQAGERTHKRQKHARNHLARKTSPEDNLLDIMRLSLTWSDPKMSDIAARSSNTSHKRKDEEFSAKMSQYFVEAPSNDDDDIESSSDEDDDYDEDSSDGED